MPIRNDSDLPRIRGDLEKCRQRIEQMRAGQVGQIPAEFKHSNAARAQEVQLNQRYADLERLSGEYVNAMLLEDEWTAAEIIEAMQQPLRQALAELLKANWSPVIFRSKIEELLGDADERTSGTTDPSA